MILLGIGVFIVPSSMMLQGGIGPGKTLAWPGWKQNEISVKVDRYDSKEAGSRKVVYYCTILLIRQYSYCLLELHPMF
jgi:hypothetical protein